MKLGIFVTPAKAGACGFRPTVTPAQAGANDEDSKILTSSYLINSEHTDQHH